MRSFIWSLSRPAPDCRLLLCFGLAGNLHEFSLVDATWTLITSDPWDQLAGDPSQRLGRMDHAMDVHDNRLYVLGGLPYGRLLRSCPVSRGFRVRVTDLSHGLVQRYWGDRHWARVGVRVLLMPVCTCVFARCRLLPRGGVHLCLCVGVRMCAAGNSDSYDRPYMFQYSEFTCGDGHSGDRCEECPAGSYKSG